MSKRSDGKLLKQFDNEIEEEFVMPKAHVSKNLMTRPADVKISEIMQELIGEDKAQENLHRILASCGDRDNEKNVADHI